MPSQTDKRLAKLRADQYHAWLLDNGYISESQVPNPGRSSEWILVSRVRGWVGRSAVGPIRLGRETSPARTRLLYAWDPTPQTAAKNAWSVPPRPSSDCVCSTMAGP
jgi:hypothetical protein